MHQLCPQSHVCKQTAALASESSPVPAGIRWSFNSLKYLQLPGMPLQHSVCVCVCRRKGVCEGMMRQRPRRPQADERGRDSRRMTGRRAVNGGQRNRLTGVHLRLPKRKKTVFDV